MEGITFNVDGLHLLAPENLLERIPHRRGARAG
jgi:hypothetical protein